MLGEGARKMLNKFAIRNISSESSKKNGRGRFWEARTKSEPPSDGKREEPFSSLCGGEIGWGAGGKNKDENRGTGGGNLGTRNTGVGRV